MNKLHNDIYTNGKINSKLSKEIEDFNFDFILDNDLNICFEQTIFIDISRHKKRPNIFLVFFWKVIRQFYRYQLKNINLDDFKSKNYNKRLKIILKISKINFKIWSHLDD